MTASEIRTAIRLALRPGHFFVKPPGRLQIDPAESKAIPWELFRGHLLDRSQTRLEKELDSYSIFCLPDPGTCSEPLLAIRWDTTGQVIYVTRHIEVYGWEAYEAAGGIIESRETRKWQPELVATLDLAVITGPGQLLALLEQCLFLAVVGASRLPITSLESPLPAYSLGRFGYFPPGSSEHDAPRATPEALIQQSLSPPLSLSQQAKLLELCLRASDEKDIPGIASAFLQRSRDLGLDNKFILQVLRAVFNEVALSPYTGFVGNLLRLLRCMEPAAGGLGVPPVVDVVSYMLRNLGRHLTAFDLVTFHNQGANYPDALALDEMLRYYLDLIERNPLEFEDRDSDGAPRRLLKRRRRRALRQALSLRVRYQGHPVPDQPTSPGENLRVMPAPYERVPQEQIEQPSRRQKRLFAGEPDTEELLSTTSHRLWEQSLQDLDQDSELRELGMATYLDRPLGVGKQPGEVDRTPLLSYEAFSARIARSRLDALLRREMISSSEHQQLAGRLEGLSVRGVGVQDLPGHARPGVVALEDALRASSDFVFLRTIRSSLHGLLGQYDWEPLREHAEEAWNWLSSADLVLLIRSPRCRLGQTPAPLMTAFDPQMQPRIELGLYQEVGPVAYREFAGVEYLAEGLRVLRVWECGGQHAVRELTGGRVVIAARLEK